MGMTTQNRGHFILHSAPVLRLVCMVATGQDDGVMAQFDIARSSGIAPGPDLLS